MSRTLSTLVVVMALGLVPRAHAASLVFKDDFNGHPVNTPLVGTIPDVNGLIWTGVPTGEILYASGGGVQDVGPNSGSSQVVLKSVLSPAYPLSSLPAGEVFHLQVTMKNISTTPATNVLQSSRVDLLTSAGGPVIYLGELSSGGNWAANSGPAPGQPGNPLSSTVTTMQSDSFLLDLYLDPFDEFEDGPHKNAVLVVTWVGGTARYCGRIADLSHATTVSAVQVVRNVDDEVFFDDLTLETIATPRWIVFHDDLNGATNNSMTGSVPEVNGGAWMESGLVTGQLRFAAMGGVQDTGPNSQNAIVRSTLTTPFDFSAITPESCEVLHMQVAMENISLTPATNPLAATRAELLTSTGGVIYLGELNTGGSWGANSGAAPGAPAAPISSGLSTAQSGRVVLDLYLDPHDQFNDGPTYNAKLATHGTPQTGIVIGLTPNTIISQVRLVRNVDDEVLFDDLLLEAKCAPEWGDLFVGAVKEVVNHTGQAATGFEWLVTGLYTGVIFEFSSPGFFNDFTATPGVGTSLFQWEAVSPFSLPPDGSATFGFRVPGPIPRTLKAAWTLDGEVTACVPQITVFSDLADLATFWLLGSVVSTPPICPEDEWYVGELSVEWFAVEVPLEDLNGSTNRFPIRTDVIAGTFLLPARGDVPLSLPLPPPANARFAVIKVSVADNPSLADASVDFLQVALTSPTPVPAASRWGIATMVASLVLLGALAARRRRDLKAS